MILDKADVVVVGGGIVGVSSAYFLAKRGHDVALVEQHELAHGASGRNLGYLWMHNRNAGYSLELARAGRALYDGFAEELGPSFEYRSNGGMIYFHTDDQRRVYAEFVEARRADGLKIELLDEQAAHEAAPILSPDVIGATFSPEDGQIRTPKFVRSLAQACRRMGVRIYEDTAALGLLRSGGRAVGVRTVSGDVPAGQVVWATGAWSGMLQADGVEVPFKPERLGAIMLGRVPEQLDKVLYGPLAAKNYAMIRSLPSYKDEYFTASYEDPGHGVEHLECVSKTEDGNLFIGCPMDMPDDLDHRMSAIGLKMGIGALLEAFPQYRNLGVEGVWTGILPSTADSLPIVDRVDAVPGLLLATGHIYGNVAGPISGKLISELASGVETSLRIDELALDRPGLQATEDGLVRW
ncbi:FAD-binding oxidoreductase [Planosporangium thailandense]|uniref:FAD-binding oxidoreductase n=1 Tax=Planosporangium thailandense TaxID=765197 RepID=A0ABX0XV25_9ACTN|nr:FAD-binding oxidoreductase [Planosporangium thailandense]NJC69884.1 FAD-binding oxidoreductase [Planosporangium thailandense]